MRSDQSLPEEPRMITFDAIAPNGSRERLRFETSG
jgi:hypothetical protein